MKDWIGTIFMIALAFSLWLSNAYDYTMIFDFSVIIVCVLSLFYASSFFAVTLSASDVLLKRLADDLSAGRVRDKFTSIKKNLNTVALISQCVILFYAGLWPLSLIYVVSAYSLKIHTDRVIDRFKNQ
tara:strand:+ start:877 stop:1260 length:384 start_codon:yes stop_codon:yes gene_type:complete